MEELGGANPGIGVRPGMPTASNNHRVGYMPALDGVRALAVLAVMAYHSGLSVLPAGFFGVDAFFVLSGFLITTLLLTEWSGTQRIALRAFWARRARRLLPALLLMLLFVVAYARFVAAPGTYPGLRFDSIAALFYSANWRFIASGQNYFVQTGPVTPLLHTWSLAIEEQFYILWPLLVLVMVRVGRRRSTRALTTLLAVSVLGALASAIEMALLFHPAVDPTRVYFGTDTHAQCLLVGTALAAGVAWWRRRDTPFVSSGTGRTLLTGAGLLGAGACAWAWSQLHDGQVLVFRGGFLIVSVSVAAVIASTVLHPSGVVARAFGWTPLRFIGRISYGMYLWHFPLDIALSGARTGVHGIPLFLFRSLITAAVATVSFYALERPIRSGALLSAAAARVATPAAVVGTALVVVAATVSPSAASGTVVLAPHAHKTLPASPEAAIPTSLAKAPVRVMIVGDSTAESLWVGLARQQSQWHLALDNLSIQGCGVALGTWLWGDHLGRLGMLRIPLPCETRPGYGYVPWTSAWPNWLREVRPNLVVLLAGRWEVTDRLYLGHRTNILAPEFAAYVKRMLERAVAIGTSTGAQMVIMTAPCYSAGEQPNGLPFPEDNIRRVQAYNRLVREVGAEFPSKVYVQDLFALACPHGKYRATFGGSVLRGPDGIHFSTTPGTGGELLAPVILPLWEYLGHLQEATGGLVVTGPLPDHVAPQ